MDSGAQTVSAPVRCCTASRDWRGAWLWLAAVLLAGGPSEAAVPTADGDRPLRGDEILIGAIRVAPGDHPSGVYAWRPGSPLWRVATYAGYPCWSPTRRQLAFERSGVTCVAGLGAGSTREISGWWYLTATVPLLDNMQASPIVYTPDGRGLVRWCWRTTASAPGAADIVRAGIMADLVRVDAVEPPELLIDDPSGHIGQVAFSSDGRRVCHEVYELEPGRSAGRPRLRLLDRQTGAATPFPPDRPADGDAGNPAWSADGRFLSFDMVGDDGMWQTWIHDFERRESRALAAPDLAGRGARVLEWSPVMPRLLVAQQTRVTNNVAVWDVLPEPRRVTTLGMAPYVHGARWSPDGMSVAILGGQSMLMAQDGAMQLDVWGVEGGLTGVPIPPELRITSFDW